MRLVNVVIACFLLIGMGMGSPLPTHAYSLSPADTTDLRTHLLPYLDEQIDEALWEQWSDWWEAPLFLNQAGSAELHQLPGLDVSQAIRLLTHRRAHGPFQSVEDLHDVLDASTVALIRPFVQVASNADQHDTSSSQPSWWKHGWNVRGLLRTGRRLERARGYTDATAVPYLGSPYRMVIRQRAWNRHIDLGLTADKRPGEPIEWNPDAGQYGPDHLIGYAMLRNQGPVNQLIVGSYQVAFGQGLALWTGPRFSSVYGGPRNLSQQGSGLRPYRGTSPHTYLRGAGITLNLFRSLQATAFASHRNLDATLDTLHTGAVVARSIRSSSLRRTETERSHRRQLPTTHIGSHMQWQSARIHVGVLGLYTQFGHPIRPALRPDTQPAFAGEWTTHWSVHAQYVASANTHLFAEGAQTGPRGQAAAAGLHTAIGRHATLAVRGYYTNASYDPLEWGGVAGRSYGGMRGITARIALDVHPSWTLQGTLQQEHIRIPQFQTTRPETAVRGALALHFRPHNALHVYAQGQMRRHDVRTQTTAPHGPTFPVHAFRDQANLRVHVTHTFSSQWQWSARTAYTHVHHSANTESGTLLWTEVQYTPTTRVHLNTRWTLFDTDSFDSRLFAYEPDVLYGFSVPALFDQGQRAHLLARVQLTDALLLESRYSVTAYTHRAVIGSGQGRIDDSRVRDWRIQLRWAF